MPLGFLIKTLIIFVVKPDHCSSLSCDLYTMPTLTSPLHYRKSYRNATGILYSNNIPMKIRNGSTVVIWVNY